MLVHILLHLGTSVSRASCSELLGAVVVYRAHVAPAHRSAVAECEPWASGLGLKDGGVAVRVSCWHSGSGISVTDGNGIDSR